MVDFGGKAVAAMAQNGVPDPAETPRPRMPGAWIVVAPTRLLAGRQGCLRDEIAARSAICSFEQD